MKWILIMWIYYSGYGVSITTQEFNNEKSCVFALQKVIREDKNIFMGYEGICVPKGEESEKNEYQLKDTQ